jgi:hypothetical protein
VPIPCKFYLSSGKLVAAASGDRQGRIASGRTLSARWLHRHQHGAAPRISSPSTTSAGHASNGSRRARARSNGRGSHADLSRPTPSAFQLHALTYNLGNFLRTLATPEPIKDWSLTSLKQKLIKIGAKVISRGRYVTFQMAEVAIPRNLFADILRLIAELRPPPVTSTA